MPSRYFAHVAVGPPSLAAPPAPPDPDAALDLGAPPPVPLEVAAGPAPPEPALVEAAVVEEPLLDDAHAATAASATTHPCRHDATVLMSA
jgi:hypothetical protein